MPGPRPSSEKSFLSVMPFKEMIEQYPIPEREANTIDWSKIDEESRSWIAGQFDGDGSVGVYSGYGLKVCVGKAENAWHALDMLKDMLGGNIIDMYEEKGSWQAMKIWYINNRTALEFCRVIQKYCFLKRPQVIKALEYPADEMRLKNMQPVVALDIKSLQPVKNYVSMLYAAQTLKTQTGHISEVIRGKKPTIAGFKWAYLENPIKREKVEKDFKNLTSELKKMKHVAHEELLGEMPLAYAAGFIDADGCISYEKGIKMAATQKYRAICDAFCNQFGGSVSFYRTEGKWDSYTWSATGENARLALNLIGPFLKEKQKQREVIALGVQNKEASADIKIKLSKLKGRQLLKIATKMVDTQLSMEVVIDEDENNRKK